MANETFVLYELVDNNNIRFSPYCWRVHMLLDHLNIEFKSIPVYFSMIKKTCNGKFKTLPIIESPSININDSFHIATYIANEISTISKVFGSKSNIDIIKNIDFNSLHKAILRICIFDIHEKLHISDKKYFRESREELIGCKLEEFQILDKEYAINLLNYELNDFVSSLRKNKYIINNNITYGDFMLYGSIKWLLNMSESITLHDLPNTIINWFNDIEFNVISRKSISC